MLVVKTGFTDDYDVLDDLGRGQFAVVKRVKHKQAINEERAAKIIRKRTSSDVKYTGLNRSEIMREAQMLAVLSHKNIITLHDIYESDKNLILILELVPAGELFDYICENESLSEEDVAGFVFQILEGVNHIHENGIVHLDLKPENIMIADRLRQNIKIIDFGISKWSSESEQIDGREIFGTPEFVSPEIVNFEPITCAADMWSVGVITLSGASPFLGENNRETFINITNVDYTFDEDFFPNTSELAKDFIGKLLIKNVQSRSTALDCLAHPWIKPKRNAEQDERRKGKINMKHFKSFIAKRRWKRSIKITIVCINIFRKAEVALLLIAGTSVLVVRSILLASFSGNLNDLKLLLSMVNIGIDCTDDQNRTAVHMAVMRDHIQILKFLYCRQACIDLHDNNGETPLHYAARLGSLQCIEFLLKHAYDINSPNLMGHTPLHLACHYNQNYVVQLLCQSNSIRVNVVDKAGETPLHAATYVNSLQLIHCLVDKGAEIDVLNQDLESPLMIASALNYADVCDLLVGYGADVDLIDSGLRGALHRACEKGNIDIAMLLIESGCNVNFLDLGGRSPLHASVSSSNFEISEKLCEIVNDETLNAQEWSRGRSALHLAVERSEIDIVRLLLKRGIDLNLKNKFGHTARRVAFLHRHKEIVNLLEYVQENRSKIPILIEQLSKSANARVEQCDRIRVKVFGSDKKQIIVDGIRNWSNTTSSNLIMSVLLHKSSLRSRSEAEKMISSIRTSKGGIRVINLDTSLIDLSLWLYESIEHLQCSSYYDHFVGDTNCIHLICYDTNMDVDNAIDYVTSYIEFIRIRMPVTNVIGNMGSSLVGAAIVCLIAIINEEELSTTLQEKISSVYETVKYAYMDASEVHIITSTICLSLSPECGEISYLLNILTNQRVKILKTMENTIGLYKATVDEIERKLHIDAHKFPRLMYWSSFVDFIRTSVNILADENEHIGNVVCRLQMSGRIVFIEGVEHVVCIEPSWLFDQIDRLIDGTNDIEDAIFERTLCSLGIICQLNNNNIEIVTVPRKNGHDNPYYSSSFVNIDSHPCICALLQPINDPNIFTTSWHCFWRIKANFSSSYQKITTISCDCFDMKINNRTLANVACTCEGIKIRVYGDNELSENLQSLVLHVWTIMRSVTPRLLIDTLIGEENSYSINQSALSKDDLKVKFALNTPASELTSLAKMNLAKAMDYSVICSFLFILESALRKATKSSIN